jgi:hypothetical protein
LDESELRAFYYHNYCSLSFYSLPIFLRGREKEGKGENWRQKLHGDQFHPKFETTKKINPFAHK